MTVRLLFAILGFLAQRPLLSAVVVACCGVALIMNNSVSLVSTPSAEPQRTVHEQLHQRYVTALAELRAAGVNDSVEVVDFGDGIGLGVSQSVEAGTVLLTVPEALSLDLNSTPSCPTAAAKEAALAALANDGLGAPVVEIAGDCRAERSVVAAVAEQVATRLTGLLTLLVMERRRSLGQIDSVMPATASAVLAVLPDLDWQATHGIFAIDGEEFRVLGEGTSMEAWRAAAIDKTAEAREFIQKTDSLEADLGGEVSLEEVRWAYLVLHSVGQWVEEESLDDGVELPTKALFLWPLFLARPTSDWHHGAAVRFDADLRVYEVVASRAMRPGEEVLFVDRGLSDASALAFRGLWLSARHRARLDLDVGSIVKDPQSEPTLQKYGCGGQPLRLYVQARRDVDAHFLSCMRLLALSPNAKKLQRVAERSDWAQNWPETSIIGRAAEAAAAEMAITVLQQALLRLSNSTARIREAFGSDPVAARPTLRVREAETSIMVGLLKSMKELQLLSGNEYLFDALFDAQRSNTRRASAPPTLAEPEAT